MTEIDIISRFSTAELQKLIDRAIYPFGRYQIFLFIILCINSVIIALNHALTTFHIYTPADYYCADDNFESTENSTCISDCKIYEFEGSYTSIVTEWSLICNKRYLSALVNTIYFSGVTVGSLMCGVLADKFGRKKLVLVCLYAQGLFGASLYFSQNLVVFMVLRFFQGLFIQGLQGVTYSLLQELTPTRHLTFTGLAWEVFWAFGLIILGGVAYSVYDWRNLQLVLTIPTLITLSWCWLIPESPSWNITKDRNYQAFKTVKIIAKRNKDATFFNEIATVCQSKIEKEERVPLVKGKMIDLVRNKILLKHLLVMIGVWFSVTLSYYGILLFMPNLAGNFFLNFIIGALIEIAAYVLAFFVLSSSTLGRRFSMAIYQYLNAACCLTLGLLSLIEAETTWRSYCMITLALVGKGLAVSAFAGMFIQGAELFPTVIRSSAFGIIGFSARVGSLVAPQIILLGEETHSVVPMVMMATFLLVTATASLTVPETVNKNLPNTMTDVDDAWGRKSR